MKKRSLWISACAALAAAAALAGCGKTTYFDGRILPPSGLINRVIIAIQNPGALYKGALQFVDAFYDERSGYNGKPASFSISGYGGALPISIQNMPEEQFGEVYGAGDGSFTQVNYATERRPQAPSAASMAFPPASSLPATGATSSPPARRLTSSRSSNQSAGGSYPLNLPGVYRVSVNPGGSMAVAFVQNSNYAYYPRQLTTAQTLSYSGGPATWPKAAVDCEPQAAPAWCLFQMQSPDNHYVDGAGVTQYYGAPLAFDRPVKAVFSSDGSTAYILSCGPECGGVTSSYTPVPVAPLIFLQGQSSGLLPTASALLSAVVPIPGGATNALVDSSTMYVVGQAPHTVQGQTLFGGNLTVVNLSANAISTSTSISDGTPGAASRMLEADDNTLWIAMTGCTVGVRYATNAAGGYGCLTMFNTSTNTVTLLEPYIGDATGIAAVTGLHKIYTAEGGQVYIYSTKDGSSMDNQYVTVTGTAYDVAYMDAITDTDNTVY